MKRKFIVFGLPLVLIVFFLGLKQSGFAKEEADTGSVSKKNVETVKVERGELTEKVPFSAFIKHKKEVILMPEISGRLVEITKKEGDFVQKGELLARVDADELFAQAALTNKQIESSKRNALNTNSYYDQLVDEAEIALEKAENAYSIAKDESDEDERRLAKRDRELAHEALQSAKRLRDLQNSLASGQVGVLEKQAALNNALIENSKIKAPFSGVIARKYEEEGALVAPKTAIFMLVDDSGDFEAELQLPLDLAKNVHLEGSFSARNESGEERELIVYSISPISDQITRKVNLTFKVRGENLVSGELLGVMMPARSLSGVVMVSSKSIVRDYHNDVLFVIKDEVAHKRVVEIGVSDGDFVEIKEGIKEGEEVVVVGQQNLVNGNKVEIYEK